ncbi:MAG: hypothetical protein KAI79_16035 [Bacteroidales bacterium]|nr:hypothetical protein [Bacteroidales bacterium]
MKQGTEVLLEHHPKSLNPTNSAWIIQYDSTAQFLLDCRKMPQEDHTKTFMESITKIPEMDLNQVELIKNEVRNKLLKKGIISGTIYEGFTYGVDGLILDIAELATGNSQCFMTPLKKYDKFFYELYVNMSLPGHVESEEIQIGLIKLIETIKLLEEHNIEIKINVIDYGTNVVDSDIIPTQKKDILIIIPVCSHTDYKDYKLLYPYFSEAMERGPMFELAYSLNNDQNPGGALQLENAVNLWEIDEVALSERAIATSGLNLRSDL